VRRAASTVFRRQYLRISDRPQLAAQQRRFRAVLIHRKVARPNGLARTIQKARWGSDRSCSHRSRNQRPGQRSSVCGPRRQGVECRPLALDRPALGKRGLQSLHGRQTRQMRQIGFIRMCFHPKKFGPPISALPSPDSGHEEGSHMGEGRFLVESITKDGPTRCSAPNWSI
jgi:hypothetical protein